MQFGVTNSVCDLQNTHIDMLSLHDSYTIKSMPEFISCAK